MYPACPLPRHITALYMISVISSIALFSQSITIAGADILVYCDDPYEQVDVEFLDMPSRFGDSLPLQGFEGYLVYAEPALACSPVVPPPQKTNVTKPWILLISRGICHYEVKVRNAQASQYSAVIVHNVNSSELEPMSAENPSGIFIPSVFVSDHTGAFLRNKYLYNETRSCRHFLVINNDVPFNINTHLLLPFASIVGLCCLVMFILMIFKCLQDRRRERRNRLTVSSLRQIPTSKFAKEHPYETCAICLEDYVEGETLRLLPCSHAYHCKCIDPWLTNRNRACPVCKRRVFTRDDDGSESDFSDSDDSTPRETTPLLRPSFLVPSGSQGTQGGTFESSVASSSVESSNESVPEIQQILNYLHATYLAAIPNEIDNTQVEVPQQVNSHEIESSEENSSRSARMLQGDDNPVWYNVSSGEHSINSEPTDLDFSDNHFHQGQIEVRSSDHVGSHEVLHECQDNTNCTLHDSTPSVSVRSASPGHLSSSDQNPSIV